MKKQPFNHGWQFAHLGEKAYQPVTLPHDAMLAEPRTEESRGGINIGWFEGRDYEYQKTFSLSAIPAHAVLEFEGVYRNAEIYLNGKKAAFRPYGYTNFFVNCDGFLQEGSNSVRVICRNADQPNSRWYSGSGIYRPVFFYTGGAQYIEPDGIHIKTISLHPAVIEVSVQACGDGPLSISILDGNREIAFADTSERKATFTLPEAHLWSPETPYLYSCRVDFAGDAAEAPFGIRTLRWGKEGFLLNDQRVILRGACIHHDNGLLGAVCDPDAIERKIRLLQENGYNAIRSAHNPCSKALLDICDRLGMLVMDEYIDCWFIHKTHFDSVDYFEEWWRQDLTDMVLKDRNHPCVIMYSIGNEVSETAKPRGIALTDEMTRFLHALDDTRPVTCGINIFFNFLNSIGFGQYSDEKAAKEAARNEKAASSGKKRKEKATGSKFFNDMAGLFGAEVMKLGAVLHGSDVTTRDAYARLDIAGYNYGEKRYAKDLRKYPDRVIVGSETFCSDAYRFYEMAKTNPRLIGDFVWTGFDYLGEVGIGSWEYKDYAPSFDHGPGWIAAGAGRIDLTGKPLGEAFYTQVAFERTAGPFLAVRPPCHSGKHSPSAWKMTNAIPSWSWHGSEGKKTYIEVYARAERVDLFLNGTLRGRKKRHGNCVFVFKVPYEDGTLEAIAYSKEGKEIGRDRLITAGQDLHLRLLPEKLTAESGHLAFFRLSFTDSNGIVQSTARDLIHVSVEGGTLVGLGSACPYYERSYLSDTCDTYYGEALAIVRAGSAGSLVIHAQTDKLQAETVIPIY